tara:strand:+ start:27380 stop:29272 length:1893 start_codon:yes stop_codon:yes gene_type:complete
MSFKEYFYRLNQKKNNLYNKAFLSRYPKNIKYTLNHIHTSHFEVNGSHKETINIFGEEIDLFSDINWHEDVINKKVFPKIFCKDINIRTDELGNAKFVWELNRLQFLPSLLFKYLSTRNNKYFEQFMDIIISWKKDNPYLIGVNWHSNIEINLRLITWYWCWNILEIDKELKSNSKFKKFIDETWIPLIYMHCKYSYENPSKFSSANNHLISEYAGLFVATSLFNFKETPKWNLYAKKGLELEIDNQHSINGINQEEASKYISFVTDFLLLSWLVGENTNNKFSENYKLKLKAIFNYIYNFTDKNCNDPSYGDQDDGFCYLLENNNDLNNFKSLLVSAAIIFNKPKFKCKAGSIDFKNLILFGERGKKIYEELELVPLDFKSKFYKKEGHFVLKTMSNNKEIYTHFNASKLGFLSIAAHGHSDALSFTLNINGKPIIVDSGTYTYHSEPNWRKYFMGTLSHNTLRVDRDNQACISGPTMWSKHYKTKVLESFSSNKLDFIVATHDGYKTKGVNHSRKFSFDKQKLEIIVNDKIIITDDKKHFLELPFHFHPKIKLEKGKNNFIAKLEDEVELEFELDKFLENRLIMGSSEPILGWYSERFNRKVKCPVIYCSKITSDSINIQTKIKINII